MRYSLHGIETHPVVGVEFACGLDKLLRVLDPEVVTALAGDMCTVLDSVGRGDTMAWGFHHVAHTYTLTEPVQHPGANYTAVSWLGWVDPTWTLPDYPSRRGDPAWPALDTELGQLSLPLRMVICTNRAHLAFGDGDVLYARSFTGGADLLASQLTAEPSDWIGRPEPIEGEPSVERAPWLQVAAGISQRAPALVATGLEDAQREYTHLGYRTMCEGFMTYLLQFLTPHQP